MKRLTNGVLISRFTMLMVAGLMLATLLAACGGGSKPSATTAPAPAGTIDGAKLLAERCSRCHSADAVKREKLDAAGWDATVTEMVRRGAKLTDAEKQALVEFLAKNYGQ